MPQEERIEILKELKMVDEVILSLDDDRTVSKTLEMVKPNIFACSFRKHDRIPEQDVCEKLNIKIVNELGEKLQSSSDLTGLKELDKSKMKLNIKFIIFDLGGVLVYSPRGNIGEEVSKFAGVDYESFTKANEHIYNLTVTGEISLLDFYEKTLNKLNLKKPTAQELLSKHLEIYNNNFKLDNDVLKIILDLTDKYSLVSLTNTEKEIADRNKLKNSVFMYFKKNYLSTDLGLMKPNLDIYEYVINDLKVNPQELIFIDDKEENIIPAKNLGMNTIHYKNPIQLENDLTLLLK